MMEQGPQGYIRSRGITSWDQLHAVMVELMRLWDALPRPWQVAYAYPNPEDRRRVP
jgi:hypothetical protein